MLRVWCAEDRNKYSHNRSYNEIILVEYSKVVRNFMYSSDNGGAWFSLYEDAISVTEAIENSVPLDQCKKCVNGLRMLLLKCRKNDGFKEYGRVE